MLIVTGNANAQSVIYKKDGSQIKVLQVDKEGRIRSYKLLNDSTDVVHNISRSIIDSIRFEDGHVEKFFSQIILPETEINDQKIKKNFVGINIWPLFTSSIDIFYERLILKDKFGFKNYFLINTVSEFNPYGSYYRRVNYQFSTGLNYYFLQSDMFRFGTGMSLSTGQFDEENYTYNNDYTYPNYSQVKVQHTGLYLNISYGFIWQKIIYITTELDAPLFFKLPNNVVIFKTEIAINF